MEPDHRGKFTIEQPTGRAISLALGNFAYIEQGDDLIIIEPEAALELTDRIAAWAAASLRARAEEG